MQTVFEVIGIILLVIALIAAFAFGVFEEVLRFKALLNLSGM